MEVAATVKRQRFIKYKVDELVVSTGCRIRSNADYRQRDGEDLTEVDVGVSRMARASMLNITRSSVNSEQVAGGEKVGVIRRR
ncbi:hypothetical protein IMZ48_22550 [Candidatus Bathyarchaeota archaeon]|nr:hypothetical protein [Candidatus Bathyarchaeota archaeon]